VVKADGLAAGKGVTVATTVPEAEAAVRACFEGAFGEAGRTVVIEECLVGEEASILALTDGRTFIPLASSQDHKRVGDGDTGPNTGGMGAYSPAPVVTEALWETLRREVLDRFVAGCRQEGLDYRGVIYAGIMVTAAGPKVLEFNVRFGDPEIQAVLMRLDSDLAEALVATADARLDDVRLAWSPDPAVCVVMASAGYPGTYAKGMAISGLEAAAATGAVVFHAGTAADAQGRLVTHGGRVLGVTARGPTLRAAVDKAYRAVDCISWEGAFCRRDIAHRALAR
jgi:phosphoribosylamine--glycine ligase